MGTGQGGWWGAGTAWEMRSAPLLVGMWCWGLAQGVPTAPHGWSGAVILQLLGMVLTGGAKCWRSTNACMNLLERVAWV